MKNRHRMKVLKLALVSALGLTSAAAQCSNTKTDFVVDMMMRGGFEATLSFWDNHDEERYDCDLKKVRGKYQCTMTTDNVSGHDATLTLTIRNTRNACTTRLYTNESILLQGIQWTRRGDDDRIATHFELNNQRKDALTIYDTTLARDENGDCFYQALGEQVVFKTRAVNRGSDTLEVLNYINYNSWADRRQEDHPKVGIGKEFVLMNEQTGNYLYHESGADFRRRAVKGARYRGVEKKGRDLRRWFISSAHKRDACVSYFSYVLVQEHADIGGVDQLLTLPDANKSTAFNTSRSTIGLSTTFEIVPPSMEGKNYTDMVGKCIDVGDRIMLRATGASSIFLFQGVNATTLPPMKLKRDADQEFISRMTWVLLEPDY